MNKYKRLTPEYQQELNQIANAPKAKRSRTKITIEPFSVDPAFFDPAKHDFIVKAHKDGDQIGMMAVTHRKGGIMPYQFHVEKEHRRSGIGNAIAAKAEDWAKKDIIPSPDMTEDAKKWHAAWLASKTPQKIKKSEELNTINIFNQADILTFIEELNKSESYTQKAAKGIALLHPITLNGKSHKENGVPLHMTVKVFGDNDKMDVKQVQQHLEKFSIPKSVNANAMYYMPHKFPAGNGEFHHVLLVYGAPPHIDHIRKGSENFGPYIHNFLPHISIDKDDWHKLAKIGPVLTAEQAGIKIHPAELRSGSQVVKKY